MLGHRTIVSFHTAVYLDIMHSQIRKPTTVRCAQALRALNHPIQELKSEHVFGLSSITAEKLKRAQPQLLRILRGFYPLLRHFEHYQAYDDADAREALSVEACRQIEPT